LLERSDRNAVRAVDSLQLALEPRLGASGPVLLSISLNEGLLFLPSWCPTSDNCPWRAWHRCGQRPSHTVVRDEGSRTAVSGHSSL